MIVWRVMGRGAFQAELEVATGAIHEVIGGLALLFLVGGAGSSAHADGPWCAFYDASTYNCGFYSFEQCYETVRGAGGSCRPNFFQNFGDGRPAGRRATTGRRN